MICEEGDVHYVLLLTLQHEALNRACLARRMVEVEGALCFYVIVPPVAKAVVFADQDFGGSAWKLSGCELLLVILLESRCQLRLDARIFYDRFDSFGDICELCHVRTSVVRAQVGC